MPESLPAGAGVPGSWACTAGARGADGLLQAELAVSGNGTLLHLPCPGQGLATRWSMVPWARRPGLHSETSTFPSRPLVIAPRQGKLRHGHTRSCDQEELQHYPGSHRKGAGR